MWKFLVKNQSIEIVEREILADHQISYVQFKFTFDGDWKRFHKVVQFSQCDEVFNVVLGVDGTTLYLPSELHAGAAKMAVFGYDTASDTTVRATTVPVTLNIRESGFEGEDPPIPPTSDLYTQLLKRIENAEQGLDGKSAYEIAVEHGFVGTEEEWLASLHGADGKDGESPDMSEYPKTAEVETIIEREIAPVAEEAHTHDNQSVLDATTASYTAEEQEKLAGISPETFATNERLNEQILLVREAMAPLEHVSHAHQNKDLLDQLTASMFTDLEGLQMFEDQTRESIHTLIESVNNFRNTAHTHENKDVLDSIAAIDRGLDQNSYNPVANSPVAIAIGFLAAAKHTHENQEILDSITAQNIADLNGLQQFEEGVRYEIQTVQQSIEPVVAQAHWHHNLTILNGITQAKINEWNSVTNLKTQVNSLSSDLTFVQNKANHNADRLEADEATMDNIMLELADMQAQIDALKNNGFIVLFEYGADAIENYSESIGIMLNGGFHTMQHFCSQYPHFCCADNNYALYYGQEDFNWNAPVFTCVEKKLHLNANSKLQICYNSGFSQEGEWYLVNPPGGKIDVPITTYAKVEVDNGRGILLPFEWLQSQNFITTETTCEGIQDGEYYLAWIGRSDNTRPIIRSVKVKEAAE